MAGVSALPGAGDMPVVVAVVAYDVPVTGGWLLLGHGLSMDWSGAGCVHVPDMWHSMVHK